MRVSTRILENHRNLIKLNFSDCFLDCSGHGVCSNFTKECLCNRYWMSNIIAYLINGTKRDCCSLYYLKHWL